MKTKNFWKYIFVLLSLIQGGLFFVPTIEIDFGEVAQKFSLFQIDRDGALHTVLSQFAIESVIEEKSIWIMLVIPFALAILYLVGSLAKKGFVYSELLLIVCAQCYYSLMAICLSRYFKIFTYSARLNSAGILILTVYPVMLVLTVILYTKNRKEA